MLGTGETIAYDPNAIDTSVPEAPTRAPQAEVATTVPAGPEPVAGQQIAYAATAPASSSKPIGNAASSLLEKAENQRRSGDLDGAASTLERAVRIDSRHPLPWNRLAQVRLQQQNYTLAAELASKSNALAGSDKSLKRSNYLIIADAKRASGDVAGARVAQSRADSLL
jgi:Tfp pilus assembly protein PilF